MLILASASDARTQKMYHNELTLYHARTLLMAFLGRTLPLSLSLTWTSHLRIMSHFL